MNREITPCLKWVGGKGQILETIFDQFPTSINNYYEPFLGGGSVAIRLIQLVSQDLITLKGGIYLGDYNEDLINFYNYIKNDPDALLTRLKYYRDIYREAPTVKREKRHHYQLSHTDHINKVSLLGKDYLYYYFRQLYNHSKDRLTRSALLLILNKTCFRGLYRVGPNGFNVPYGNYSNPSIYDEDHIRSLHRLFVKCRAHFIHCDFKELREKAGQEAEKEDFWYFDPPYYPLNKGSFTSYGEGFGEEKHLQLACFCDELTTEGSRFLLSNSRCETNRERYGKYSLTEILCKRTIHSKNPNATDWEILVKNI